MCDCRKSIEQRLLDRFKETAPEAKNHRAELKGYALGIFDNSVIEVGVMPIEMTADYKAKTGRVQTKTTRSSMHFNFCPFCGEKFQKGSAS